MGTPNLSKLQRAAASWPSLAVGGTSSLLLRLYKKEGRIGRVFPYVTLAGDEDGDL